MSYFRIKEITSPATVLRQGSPLGIELGDFIYTDEVETIVSETPIVYWDDRTGEHFTWTPGTKAEPKQQKAAPKPAAEETPAAE